MWLGLLAGDFPIDGAKARFLIGKLSVFGMGCKGEF